MLTIAERCKIYFHYKIISRHCSIYRIIYVYIITLYIYSRYIIIYTHNYLHIYLNIFILEYDCKLDTLE